MESTSHAGGSSDVSRLHPSIALAPYVEALASGRRVAVLGDATLGLAEGLLARGARLVHAYDPEPARVAEVIARKAPAFGSPSAGRPAARGVVHALLGDDLGVREGAFDAVLIPDLTAFADRTEVVRRARKLCAPSGAVVVASPNPEAKRRLLGGGDRTTAPGYYELFDLLTLQFPIVRMVGQAPFVGYAIVDFAPDREPDVAFDASLMSGTEEPEVFIAIAGERHVSLDAYLVVEVPAEGVLMQPAERPSVVPSSAREELRGPGAEAQLAEMKARLVLTDAELDDLRAQKAALLQKLEATQRAEADAEARARSAAVEAARAGDEHVRAERLTHQVRDLEEELVRQRDRAQKLTKALEDEKRARQKAEIELGMTKGLPRADELNAARVEELSAELGRANGRVEELSVEVQRGNAHAEQLTTELQQTRSQAEQASGELRQARARADGLAHELLAKSKETAELRRVYEASTAKSAELSQALQIAQAKIADLEEDQVRTLRRPEPVRETIITSAEVDSGVATRLAKLTAEANAERRAAEESRRAVDVVTEQRDAALTRAKQLEASLEEERSERRDLLMAKASLEAEAHREKKRAEEIATERETEVGPEIERLESALRERGVRVAQLERDLRESERIGRELVTELEDLRRTPAGGTQSGGGVAAGPSAPEATGGGSAVQAKAAEPVQRPRGAVDVVTADAFQHRIDALAADAAQKQAELLAAGWKIQALERELSEARTAETDPPAIQRELSAALVRAQSEIASLRRALSPNGLEGTGVPRAVIEDAVLLHQQLAR